MALRSNEPYVPRLTPSPEGSPAGPGLQGSFHEHGTSQLCDFVTWGIERMPYAVRQALLSEGHATNPISMGTMCSGSEAPVLVMRAWAAAMEKHTQKQHRIVQGFSVEINKKKQTFIAEMFGQEVGALYADVNDVATKAFVPDLLRGGSPTKVAEVARLFAGFPCQDVSHYNQNRKQHKQVVMIGEARTGKVFQSLVKYAVRAGPQALLLENVMGLMTVYKDSTFSNLDYCVAALEQIGMFVFVAKLNPAMFGVPVTRDRLYILCFPLEALEKAGINKPQAARILQHLLDPLVTVEARDFDEYLLPESHPAIATLRSEAALMPEPRASKRLKLNTGKWAEAQAQLMEERGLEWWVSPVPHSSVFVEFPLLKNITYRQFDILRLHGFQFPDERGRQIDLGQSGQRAKVHEKTRSSIVTPGCSIYLGSRCRFAHGIECMHMQSIHYGSNHQHLAKYLEPLLRDLAGNAWECTCAASMVIVQEAFLAICHQRCAKEVLNVLGAPPGQQPQLAGKASPSAGAFRRAGTLGLHWAEQDLDEALSWDTE
jgi:site-specific DNA-cytosine methylase